MAGFLKAVSTVCVAGVTYLLGGWDSVLQILLVMVVIDYITGLTGALINKNVSSSIGFRGIVKKVFIFIMVMLSVQVDKMLGQTNVIRQVVCLFYITNEGISVLENMALAGLPLPEFLKNLLIQIRDASNKGEKVAK